MGTSEKFWFSTDLEIVIENENNEEFAIVSRNLAGSGM